MEETLSCPRCGDRKPLVLQRSRFTGQEVCFVCAGEEQQAPHYAWAEVVETVQLTLRNYLCPSGVWGTPHSSVYTAEMEEEDRQYVTLRCTSRPGTTKQ